MTSENRKLGDETFEYVLGELRAHGDVDLAADKAGVDRRLARRLVLYSGDDVELMEASIAMQLAQVEGKGNQRNYAKQMFLQALERHASVSEAVASQKWYTRNAFDTWKLRDPEFELAWNEAVENAIDRLRREAWRRGAEGYDEPVTHLGQYCYEDVIDPDTGLPTGERRQVKIRKFSDGLLTTLLKRYDPAFRERTGIDLTASIEGGITQEAAIKALGQLSAEELAALTKLLDVTDEDNGLDEFSG